MQAEQPQRSTWRVLALGIILVALVALALAFIDIDSVLRQLRTADWRLLAIGLVVYTVGLVGFAARWRLLLENKPSLLFTFHVSNLGHTGNILLPFRGGEALRVVMMGRAETVTFTAATSSFVVERLFEQIMRLLTLATAVAVGAGLTISPVTVLGGLGFVALTLVVIGWLVTHREVTLARGTRWLAKLPRITPEKAHASLDDLLNNLSAVSRPQRFLRALLLSLLTWIFFWGFFYLTLLALPEGFAAHQQLAVSLGALALSPPSAATQPGLFHASVTAPLAAVGFEAATLLAYAILLHALQMGWLILLSIWGLFATGTSARTLLSQAQRS